MRHTVPQARAPGFRCACSSPETRRPHWLYWGLSKATTTPAQDETTVGAQQEWGHIHPRHQHGAPDEQKPQQAARCSPRGHGLNRDGEIPR